MSLNNNIIHLEETTSTLTLLKDLSSDRFLENGFTIYSDFQSAGRGQRGNSWESKKALNLLFSTILYLPKTQANKQFIISQLISVAITDILNEEISDVSIKWPNDIYWKNKKLAGILIENNILGDSIPQTFIGVGLNLNQTVFESDAPNPISLKKITKKTYKAEVILERILGQLLAYYNEPDLSSTLAIIQKKYCERLFRKEGFHPYADYDGTFEAEIIDIEDSGLFVLRTRLGDVKKYAFKEIKYLF